MEIGSTLRGLLRLAAYFALTLASIPLQAAFLALGWTRAYVRFPRAYHRLCLRILGIEVVVRGTRSPRRPTLFISNHSSYLDIPVLSAVADVSFVAKSEVNDWPFFGLLARLQRTVFVEREKRTKAQEQRDSIAGRLQAGDCLVLFPEGTSSDGNRTLPFKTALFSVAGTKVDDAPVLVQPVSVTATHLDGLPLGHVWRALYAWYGDMELPPHLWRMVRAGRLRVVVEFHEALTVDQVGSRKALADHCWRAVAQGVERAVKNRAELPVPANLEDGAKVAVG